jgi:hypothetical protein
MAVPIDQLYDPITDCDRYQKGPYFRADRVCS